MRYYTSNIIFVYSEPDTTTEVTQENGDQQQQQQQKSSLDFNLDDLEAFMSDQMSKTSVQTVDGISLIIF